MPMHIVKQILHKRRHKLRRPPQSTLIQRQSALIQRIDASAAEHPLDRPLLKLLSFNIQVGINTQRYHHYLTRSWQHILPHAKRRLTLDRIANILSDFDIVALQEADGGSLRSSFINQTEYLAHKSLLPYWHHQLNRNLGRWAQHSNGLLSRYQPITLEDHKLPGIIPGRGAIIAKFGNSDNPLVIVMMHLALSKRTRNIQLGYLREQLQPYQHIVLMGDMNTQAHQLLNQTPLSSMAIHSVQQELPTFPSWKPTKALDHILLSDTLNTRHMEVLNIQISDHLPIAMYIDLPYEILVRPS